ncbi:MAG: PAS domain S-box protein, partial [Elusimicrobia bacterium]|nr:PAS domain S-box protein [Elusimicrobiota bacterium]
IIEKEKGWTSTPKEVITPFMNRIINNKLSQRLLKRIKFYEDKYGYKIFGEVFITNKYGANIGQTGRTSDYYQADEEWWQVAKKDGFYIREVEYDESSDIYSTDFALRVHDGTGNFLGIMKIILNIRGIISVINEVKPIGLYGEQRTMEFKLLTKDGKCIYSTEEFEFLEDFSPNVFSFFRCGVEPGQIDYFIGEGDKPGEGEKLFAYAHSKGYRDFKGLGWVLVVEHRVEEIFAPISKLRNILLGVSISVMVLSILIGFFIFRAISNPITKLKDAAMKIGKGNLDIKIDIKSSDEIGELANSFNKMTEDLRKSRDEILAARDYTDNIIKSMVDTLIVVNSEAMIKTVNQATQDLLGYKKDELIGKPVGIIFAEEEEEEEDTLFKGTRWEKLLKEGSVRDYDMVYRTKNGKKIPVSLSGSVMRDKEENLVGIVGIARDIRERKIMEEDLKRKLEFEKTISKISSYFSGIGDTDKAINESLAYMGKYRKAGRAYVFLIRDDGIAMDNTHEWCAEGVSAEKDNLQNLPVNIFPWWMKKLRNGEIIHIDDVSKMIPEAKAEKEILESQDIKSVLVLPLRKSHKLLGFIGFDNVAEPGEWIGEDIFFLTVISRIFTNAFERREAENQLKKSLSDLKATQEQLVQVEKMSSLGQMAGGVAHEINNPLTSVLATAQLILENIENISESDEFKVDIEQIIEEAKRIKDTVKDFLGFARTRNFVFEEYDINKIIDKALSVVGRGKLENFDIIKSYDALPEVKISRFHLEEVFVNLITNALHSMGEKGTLSIKTFQEGEFIIVSIKDTGKGIEKENLKKIFEPYFTTKRKKGTGLGLSTSIVTVSKHGGKIEVNSEGIGKGSEFRVYLPLQTDNKK